MKIVIRQKKTFSVCVCVCMRTYACVRVNFVLDVALKIFCNS